MAEGVVLPGADAGRLNRGPRCNKACGSFIQRLRLPHACPPLSPVPPPGAQQTWAIHTATAWQQIATRCSAAPPRPAGPAWGCSSGQRRRQWQRGSSSKQRQMVVAVAAAAARCKWCRCAARGCRQAGRQGGSSVLQPALPLQLCDCRLAAHAPVLRQSSTASCPWLRADAAPAAQWQPCSGGGGQRRRRRPWRFPFWG